MRQAMPETAAFIDALRETFGAAEINAAIKDGIAGHPTFWAKENGHEIGTKEQEQTNRCVSISDIQINRTKAATKTHASATRWKS